MSSMIRLIQFLNTLRILSQKVGRQAYQELKRVREERLRLNRDIEEFMFLRGAHEEAVAATLLVLERHAPWSRIRNNPEVVDLRVHRDRHLTERLKNILATPMP